MTELASCCCLLFRVYILKCLLSLVSSLFVDSLCVLVPVFPVSLVVLFPPFLNLLRPLSFLFLSFSFSQSCRGSFTSTSTHTSNPTPTFISSRLSVSPAWLCAGATIPGARRWGHSPRESCRPDQISTIPTGHKTNSPAVHLPQCATFFSCHTVLDFCLCNIDLFLPRHRLLQESLVLSFIPLHFNLSPSTSSAPPPRVRFLHPLHQSLCLQCDLKSADSCQSFVCSPFWKLYSLWNQAMLDGFPGRIDSPQRISIYCH